MSHLCGTDRLNLSFGSMGRSCSVRGCKSGFGNKSFKGRVYGFPLDNEEQKTAWRKALLNYIDPSTVTANMGVCELHWLPDVPMHKRHRWLFPAVPPSVFSLPSTFCPQTVQHPRDVDNRRVSSEARAQSCVSSEPEKPDPDRILNYEQLKTHCLTLG